MHNIRRLAIPGGAVYRRFMMDFVEMPGHLIRRLHQISTSIFAEEMAQSGFDLTPVQYAALSALLTHPGVDQNTLAGLIAYDRATLGGVVERLEKRGYLQREVSAADRRSRALRLTEKGHALVKTVTPAVRRVQSDIVEPLTPDEQAAFMALIAKITTAGNERARAPMRLLTRESADAKDD